MATVILLVKVFFGSFMKQVQKNQHFDYSELLKVYNCMVPEFLCVGSPNLFFKNDKDEVVEISNEDTFWSYITLEYPNLKDQMNMIQNITISVIVKDRENIINYSLSLQEGILNNNYCTSVLYTPIECITTNCDYDHYQYDEKANSHVPSHLMLSNPETDTANSIQTETLGKPHLHNINILLNDSINTNKSKTKKLDNRIMHNQYSKLEKDIILLSKTNSIKEIKKNLSDVKEKSDTFFNEVENISISDSCTTVSDFETNIEKTITAFEMPEDLHFPSKDSELSSSSLNMEIIDFRPEASDLSSDSEWESLDKELMFQFSSPEMVEEENCVFENDDIDLNDSISLISSRNSLNDDNVNKMTKISELDFDIVSTYSNETIISEKS
ncbi:Hypothetical protein SRAE_1000328300 [Strongyloides ratti]|uniref:Uncharacterized protein n=1 Tax=Strongyloides ratti TaxID=34506 RepID=A0A090LBW0_STRRB|nr:Hypothetical protein SRAE_1000328300 [Strongyloides ratti]CEF65030.1 Hypothetical protein SRAE_1000328300 [Strongyloides ratti]